MTASILRFSDAARSVTVDARHLAEELFRDHMTTNVFTLGVAYQAGLLPLSARAVEAAIRLNDVQVPQNIRAFRYGRLHVADPRRLRERVDPPVLTAAGERARAAARLSAADARAYQRILDRARHLEEETRRILAIRVGELIDYQDAAYAGRYLDRVVAVAAREAAATPGRAEVTRAVARHQYKVMAYKDEYEVARLHLKPELVAGTRDLFAAPRRVTYHLHPPLLRALGMTRKLRLGPWFTPVLGLLRGLRRLRGTPWDVFGYAEVRREERRLVGWYEGLVDGALDRLDGGSHAVALEIAELPDRIRGYESIKLANIALAKAHAASLVGRLAPEAPRQQSA
jgi:indolepyruvate ferredoxin oxidoreductase